MLSTNPVLQVEFFQLGLELILFEVHMTMFSAQEIWSGPQSQRNGTILTLAAFIEIVTISLLTTDYKCFGWKNICLGVRDVVRFTANTLQSQFSFQGITPAYFIWDVEIFD